MNTAAPAAPPPDADADGMTSVLARNIEKMNERRARDARAAPWSHRIADRVTAFAGSMAFVGIHLVIYAAWIAISLGIMPGVPQLDPNFAALATEASIEAIFLSTFVLISQNRMAMNAAEEAALDLQINLLTEHELTRVVHIVEAIAAKLNVTSGVEHEMDDIKQDVSAEVVLDEIVAQRQ